jgi:hypothetical protein
MQARRFAKADLDSNGSVDKSELQSLLDQLSNKSGQSLGSADTLLTKMDSNGDGSLSSDELDTGMKSLLPQPSSTVDFAQRMQRSDGADGPPPGGPPPDGPPPADDTSTTASASTSQSFDPLDTNQDGVVSAQESQAGMLKSLMKAMDANGDQAISANELSNFVSQLVGAASSSTASASGAQDQNGSSDSQTASQRQADHHNASSLSALGQRASAAYASMASSTANSTAAEATLSLAA